MENLKILIVEDNAATRLLLEKRLKKRQQYEVYSAEDGDSAVTIISQSYFDVVITDLMMPGDLDGIGVLEYVKRKSPQTEVIILTAHATVDNAVGAMKKGATDYLQKPINFEELFLRLDKIGAIKSLAEDATELREAMDVTERNASQTIQELEIKVSELQQMLSDIKKILSRSDIGKI
ncbi:MAG: response regulator [Thermodesulfobacteriota bacterium]|nr:response regulator [Thermodesulfobacteriota bacterium]